MGNTFNKDNDTINWNSLKTENIGDDNGQLTYDSKLLLNRLQFDLPKNIKSETDSEIDKFFSKYKTVELTENIASLQKPANPVENLSDTSPFISSDMYKNLMKSNNQENEMKGGGVLDGDDSSTSSTSSSSDEKDKKPKPKLKKYKGKKIETEKTEQSSEKISMDSDAEGLSYISSSAHTGGGDSEESNSKTEESNNQTTDSNSESEQSGGNSEQNDSSENAQETNQSGGKDLDSSSEESEYEESEYDADEFDQSGGDSEEESSDYISSPERPIKTKSKTKSKVKSKNISKSYKSKSITKSITNENSALPPSSINTSDINMITEN